MTYMWQILCGEEALKEKGTVCTRTEGDAHAISAGGQQIFASDSETEAIMAMALAHSVSNINFARSTKPFVIT